jgi:hypothetical protein
MMANMPGINYGGPSGLVADYTDPNSTEATTRRLNEQNSGIERRDKAITSGDIAYSAHEIMYKADMIRFDAGSIVFGSGGPTGSDEGKLGLSSNSPYNEGYGPNRGIGGSGSSEGGVDGTLVNSVPNLPSFPNASPQEKSELLSKGVVSNGIQGGALGPSLLPGQIPEINNQSKGLSPTVDKKRTHFFFITCRWFN